MAITERRPRLERHLINAAFATVAILFWPSAAVADYDYYCPKGNAGITANDRFIFGKAILAFPLAPSNSVPPAQLFSPQIEWKLESCSNKIFLCFDARQPRTGQTRRVFVPRNPKVGATYRYGPANAFVIGAASSSKVPTVQVIDSQELSGKTVAIKLTLRRGVGVLYIDGLNFWKPLDYQNGETCILESGTGFFSDAKVSTSPSKKIE